ncbi:hypothetical protein [Bdellovibrio bacteriovorus]|uniref:hypothetical protein n=1 Tax=Bdellovibrio TaxID=958 RepID=UPI0035A860A9
MKRYQQVLAIAAIAFTSATSFAGYDEFNCVTNDSLELSNLQCISCGISKYYADKGVEVTPSHKWLAILALKVRENKLDKDGKGTTTSTDAEVNYKQQVIKKIQAYGFCTEYVGKDTPSRSKNMHDMSSTEWRTFFEFLNRDDLPSEKSYDKLSESLGFRSTALFGSGGAKKNMDYLFEGFDEDLSLNDKRALFKDKLKQGVASDYNVSGEKIENSRKFISSGDKDQGLRNCLSDIKRRFFEQQMSDKETFKMCEVMANACDLARTPMSKNDFCVHRGMGLRPATGTGTQPRPLPPPPLPSKGTGVK